MFKVLALIIFLSLNLLSMDKLKIGVLAYGTVNWELEVLKQNNLDKKNGFELEFVKLASKNAQAIALQSNSVDIIVTDWIWVNTQRANDKDFTFYPYSKATGTLYVSKDSKAQTFLDLKDGDLGVTGSAYDKTWLILRAYSKYKYKKDLKDIINPVYASAPIIYQKMNDGSLSAAINYWHFNAKLKARGARALIEMKDVLKQLDINSDVSFVGWTFNRAKAMENQKLYNSFIKATHDAKDILLSDDTQWEKIKPLMNVKNDADFNALKEGYKEGVIKEFTKDNLNASYKIFELLLREGGRNLVENSNYLQTNTFWKFEE